MWDEAGRAPELIADDFTGLVRHHSEQVRPPQDVDGLDQDRLDAGRQACRGLWFGQPSNTGMVTLRGMLDPEAAAVLKSAVDPLSTPCPSKDKHGRTVEPDPRTPATRRADALLEIVARGVATADGLPVTDRAKLVVTVEHDVLAGTLRGTGLALTGDVLPVGTVRRPRRGLTHARDVQITLSAAPAWPRWARCATEPLRQMPRPAPCRALSCADPSGPP